MTDPEKNYVSDTDEKFMRRAIELARHGAPYAAPNPMVGAVIVHEGRIIGEGYHRRCGEGHAEVNAVASVSDADKALLPESTIYVTLEPCSHYGKTPPCAELIVEKKLKRVVIGSIDPFAKVSGRGIRRLRDAGIEVVTGVLEDECRAINPHFMTAHTHGRPYVTLKWAQSADGFMDRRRDADHTEGAMRLSGETGETLVHRLRSLHDALLTTSRTVNADGARLTLRLWDGKEPLRVIVDRQATLDPQAPIFSCGEREPLVLGKEEAPDVPSLLRHLYSLGITSVMTEAGPTMLQAIIDSGMWDEARVEVNPVRLGKEGSARAPQLPIAPAASITLPDGNRLLRYFNV
ncbi:MAG: bifunctional diaminohydroxyphosphoribosylaminopyrimidine deaminase/5-amino-6-(5-phosphoribosylamino)uracil reductase RibD [Muribaculaceae bacterium]|nr:bifunctional diaminohydroxyphosphoribosylaminopyrimidine deaminase/5-amino-6-(5-phosphoribosylamino)uracil reductase RibD [Muribaculaceae bacterium]